MKNYLSFVLLLFSLLLLSPVNGHAVTPLGTNSTKDIPLRPLPAPSFQNQLLKWCQNSTQNSPSSNLLRAIIRKRMRRSPALPLFDKCEIVTHHLMQVQEIKLDFVTTGQVKLSFESLNLLPRLRELHLSNFPDGLLNLKSISNLKLDKLTLENLNLKNLRALSQNKVRELSLEKNPLNELYGIGKFVGLESLNISNTFIKSLSSLKNLKLLKLMASGINSAYLLNIDSLNKDLQVLDLRNTVIHSFLNTIRRFTSLKSLWLTGNSQRLDLTNNTKLQFLSLSGFKLGEITFPKSLGNLEQISTQDCELESISFLSSADKLKKANLSSNRISDLSVFRESDFPNLSDLDLSINPILNLYPLKNLSNLKSLGLFRTPIQRNLVPRNELNCPASNAPVALVLFCSL